MQFGIDLTGAKVILQDEETKKLLLESVIKNHNLDYGMIDIEGKIWELEGRDQVEAIITLGKQRYVFQGLVQPLPGMKDIEIALYKGTNREDRVFKRFLLNTYAEIEEIYRKGAIDVEQRQTIVEVENISSSGIQFLGNITLLNVADSFLMSLSITAKDNRKIKGKVVWKDKLEHQQAIYGCKFYE